MSIFRKQTARAPLTTVLLVLLLALSIAASSIGFTAWAGARQQSTVIEGEYLTIAVPTGKNFEEASQEGSFLIKDGDFIFDNGRKYVSPASAEETARKSEYYLGSDHRILLSAHIPGSTNLSSGTLDPMAYNWAFDRDSYELSVLALRCVSAEEVDTWLSQNQKSYLAQFELVDGVCWVDAYDHEYGDDLIWIPSQIFTSDGEIPFEVGKTYLVRGGYSDYEVRADHKVVTDDEGNTELQLVGKIKDDGFTPRSMTIDPFHRGAYAGTTIGLIPGGAAWTVEQKLDPESGMIYQCTPEENCWPYFAEYSGDWRDYLETEEGAVWKNEIIPYFERNHSSVAVILTDNVESMYTFNTGLGSILDGDFFTDADYANGNRVCMVSASYAQVNDLSVGDTLHMDFYNSGYTQTDYPVLQGSGRKGLTIWRYELRDESRIGYEEDYTIVGIYSAPEWEAGSQSFHADTVFAPKSSVPNAGSYIGEDVTLLNTVILQNGSIEAFEAHMAANDKAGAYTYYDQGYTDAVTAIRTLTENSQRLMLVGTAMFVLASMLFLLLFARRVAAVIRSMRLLGVPQKQTWLECLGTLFTQEILAVLLGNALAVILYERITVQLLSSTPALSMETLLLCGGVQLGSLLLIGGAWMHSIACRNLMQRKEGGPLWKRNKAAFSGA